MGRRASGSELNSIQEENRILALENNIIRSNIQRLNTYTTELSNMPVRNVPDQR